MSRTDSISDSNTKLTSIFDICAIINRDLHLGIPHNDDDIIHNLVTEKIISQSMGELVRNMKGMRNILIHRYGTINDLMVYEVLATQLDDIASLCTYLESLLDCNA
ncbi:MAG: DUF86 domain-containing protein [Methanospirillaceae archaeon]|nr:DUF86 domain-containing protein [Methanospirillaceae archaeon]